MSSSGQPVPRMRDDNVLKAQDIQMNLATSAPAPLGSRALPVQFNHKPTALHQDPSNMVRISIPLGADQPGGALKREELAKREIHLGLRSQEVAQKQRSVDERLDRLNRLIAQIERMKMEELHNDEQAVIVLSLRIAEKVLEHEIENGRYRIGEAVKSALQAVRDKGAVVVTVNPQDLECVKEAVEKYPVEGLSNRVTVKADPSITPASCWVETDSGKICSEVRARLQLIEQSLLTKTEETA